MRSKRLFAGCPAGPAILAVALLCGLLLTWLAGCQPAPDLPAPTTVRLPATALPQHPAIPPTAAAVTSNDVMTLTWWVPDFLGPASSGSSGSLLAGYLQDFATARDDKIKVDTVVKARYGRGGLLDLMQTAQPVAPAILPDIVVLDLADLPAAAGAGLLQPLDTVLDPAVFRSLYPFARQAGQFDDHILAVPFIADVEHLIYNRTLVKVPPVTWPDMYAGGATYLFPIGSPQSTGAGPADAIQRTFVSQYLSAGGTINPATRRLDLAQAPLQHVLLLYSQARSAGVLSADLLEVTSVEDCWTLYSDDTAAMANVSARRYLVGRDTLKNTSFAAPPGWNGPAVPVAEGWALAIVTPDPVRQRAAADWLAWFLATDRWSAWALAAGWLPTAPQVWAPWGNNPYYEFLRGQLAVAVPRPAGPSDPQAASQLQKALRAVVRDNASPSDALRLVMTPVPK